MKVGTGGGAAKVPPQKRVPKPVERPAPAQRSEAPRSRPARRSKTTVHHAISALQKRLSPPPEGGYPGHHAHVRPPDARGFHSADHFKPGSMFRLNPLPIEHRPPSELDQSMQSGEHWRELQRQYPGHGNDVIPHLENYNRQRYRRGLGEHGYRRHRMPINV